MRIRTVHLQTRNPIVAVALLLVVLALLAALFTVGIAVAGVLAVVGGAGLLARRALRGRLPAPEAPRLDRSREVFARRDQAPRLPPAGDPPA
jgi:hypothetical protein